MTPLDALAQFISVDLAIGTLGQTVFKDYMPDANDGSLDTCFVIASSGGGPPALTRGDDTDSPSFQLRSRSLDADVARSNLLTVFEALHGLTETTLLSVRFKLVYFMQSNPVPLGRDERQRFEYVQNFRALVAGVTR